MLCVFVSDSTQGETWLWASFLIAVGNDKSAALLHNISFAFTDKYICIPELYIFLASTQMLSHLT